MSPEPVDAPVAEMVATALGPVEVARAGEGPPVLVVHGMPGGSDQALAMGRSLVDAGFGVIAPSRPGYLGTPLDGREAIDQQPTCTRPCSTPSVRRGPASSRGRAAGPARTGSPCAIPNASPGWSRRRR